MSEYRLVIGNRNYSSWSLRGGLVMRLAGVAFSETVIPLDQPQSAALLAQHSPTKLVPCLLHGDRVVWDSMAIAEYMAEQAPAAGLWPKDAGARALARSVVAEMHSGFTAIRQSLPMDMIRHHKDVVLGDAELADIARIEALWAQCIAASGGPYLFGAWSVADCFYAPVVSRFQTYDVVTGSTSAEYSGRVRAHPHYREWLDAAQAEPWVIPI